MCFRNIDSQCFVRCIWMPPLLLYTYTKSRRFTCENYNVHWFSLELELQTITITAGQDTMGDYTSPKKRVCPVTVDKLRRRIELYKRHHNGAQRRFVMGQKVIYEQQQQHSSLLLQRVFDSKAAKKASKSKTKSDNSNSEHRSQLVTVSDDFLCISICLVRRRYKVN